MGQQQLLLLVLGAIIVGIAIIAGIFLFSNTSVSSNRDAIIADLQSLGQYAYRYKLRPEPLGGGGLFYTGFTIPSKLASNDNGSYSSTVAASSVTLIGQSAFGYGTITAVLDSTGALGTFTYSGDFQ